LNWLIVADNSQHGASRSKFNCSALMHLKVGYKVGSGACLYPNLASTRSMNTWSSFCTKRQRICILKMKELNLNLSSAFWKCDLTGRLCSHRSA